MGLNPFPLQSEVEDVGVGLNSCSHKWGCSYKDPYYNKKPFIETGTVMNVAGQPNRA